MKITNKYGVSQSLYDAIVKTNEKYTKGEADFSATELIQPARIRKLTKDNYDKLSEDVTDLIWRFFGSLAHQAIAEMDNRNVLSEERLYAQAYSFVISGSPDRFDGDIVTDYKFTSKYAVKNGVKPEWEAQLNIYNYLLLENGFKPKELWIEAILKDAVRQEPKVVRKQANMWHVEKTERYILDRIEAHVAAEKELPLCSDEERWAEKDCWAQMKKGRKSAIKLHDTEEKAMESIDGLGSKYYVEFRKGISKRCANGNCIIANNNLCTQWMEEKEGLNA